MELVECVPNFSEGRRFEVISRLAAAAGPRLLDADFDPDHNRLVVSIAGAEEGVLEGSFAAIAEAVESIDLRRHQGVHPRVGAADVVPFVPLGGDGRLDRCVALARSLGERVWAELRVPVLFYGAAAPGEPRPLRQIRGSNPPPPDLGEGRHPSAGWVCIGARPPLIAYNVLLPGAELAAASAIARSLRATSGGLAGVQALAFPVSRGAQVSMNLTAPHLTPPEAVLAAVRERSLAMGLRAGPDEVVGLCPALYGLPAASGALLECRLAATGLRLAGVAEEEVAQIAGLPFEKAPLVAATAALSNRAQALGTGGGMVAEGRALLDHAVQKLAEAVTA